MDGKNGRTGALCYTHTHTHTDPREGELTREKWPPRPSLSVSVSMSADLSPCTASEVSLYLHCRRCERDCRVSVDLAFGVRRWLHEACVSTDSTQVCGRVAQFLRAHDAEKWCFVFLLQSSKCTVFLCTTTTCTSPTVITHLGVIFFNPARPLGACAHVTPLRAPPRQRGNNPGEFMRYETGTQGICE